MKPVPWLHSIPPYVPGRSKEDIARQYHIDTPIKMASNENPLGPSPLAIEAMKTTIRQAHLYPDPDARTLRTMAAAYLGCTNDMVIAGNGSDEIIDLLCRAFIAHSDEIIVPECTFSYYEIAAMACGASIVKTGMKGMDIDILKIEEAIGPRTRMIFIANPNNPTGAYLNKDKILYLIKICPKNIIIVLDQAYAAFTRAKDFIDGIDLINGHDNLIVMHTLSKSHGLAGLRIGFGIAGKPIIENMRRIKPPFNLNLIALEAGKAALDDNGFLERTLSLTWQGLDYLYSECSRLGLEYIPSQTNFVLIRIGPRAVDIYEELLKKGIITRYMGSYGLDEYLRISVGLKEENMRFVAALQEALCV
ncbi:MAG: histidinol-phosphate transaminase [Thermodesulfobacteriota bacterium]|nr:histidinol-phosphate transaminase [Thermodesulfobacteriota bacterium]